MKPRFLRYLRLNDQPPVPRDDLGSKLPVKIDDLTEWFEFCRGLAQQRQWEYELLTIDFNFKDDLSGPWFPQSHQDPKEYNADFLSDPLLSQLQWSNRLNDVGPNSGLLIGAQLASNSAYRDLPCGVAFHTYHPAIVIRDMSSAMLATQILLASGAMVPSSNLRDTLRAAIDQVQLSHQRPLLGLGDAVMRFRQAFLQRAGASASLDEGAVRLWMEPTSLWTLLEIFRMAQSDEELDQKLQRFGIEFFDRNGTLDCLDIRSVFLDRLIRRDELDLINLLPRLTLADVKPAGDARPEPGAVWRFIETLATNTPANVKPVLDFFRQFKGGIEAKTINDTVKRKIHRLIAVVFAWLDLYAERWFDDQSRGWDPFEDQLEVDFPTKTEQVGQLLKIIDRAKETSEDVDHLSRRAGVRSFDPGAALLPLHGSRSIFELVSEHCVPGSPLYRALRYDCPNSAQLAQKRLVALERLLAYAARWRCVEEEMDATENRTGRYRLKHVELPQRRLTRTSHVDLAARLGFDVTDAENAAIQLKRIIQGAPGFEHTSVLDFLSALEERPLPSYLKWMGWAFMDEFWGSGVALALPYDAWPLCLSETASQTEASEKVLADVKRDRELMAALMDEHWRGLQLLSHLGSSPMSATSLASMVGQSVDAVAANLARLVQSGAVEIQYDLFTCTERGRKAIQSIEKSTNVNLSAEL